MLVLEILSVGDSLGRFPFKAGTFPGNSIDILQCALEEAFLVLSGDKAL